MTIFKVIAHFAYYLSAGKPLNVVPDRERNITAFEPLLIALTCFIALFIHGSNPPILIFKVEHWNLFSRDVFLLFTQKAAAHPLENIERSDAATINDTTDRVTTRIKVG